MKIPIARPANVVFDVDDVLWPLNEEACRRAGVPYEKIICFQARENPLLTKEEKRRMHEAYTSPDLHERMPLYPGAKAFGRMARDPRIRPWICTNSLSKRSIDDKKRNLEQSLGEDFGLFHQMFNLIDMDGAHEKKFPPAIWCLFDDSPHNAVLSNACHILMPERPWNMSDLGIRTMEPIIHKVRRYSCIAEAVDIFTELMDQDLGPYMG